MNTRKFSYRWIPKAFSRKRIILWEQFGKHKLNPFVSQAMLQILLKDDLRVSQPSKHVDSQIAFELILVDAPVRLA